MAEQTNENVVLCCYRDHRRSVKYSGSTDTLNKAVRKKFSDILPEECEVFLQLKDEFWDGQFVDVNKDDSIPNHAIVKVVVEKPSPKVISKGCIFVSLPALQGIVLYDSVVYMCL